MTRVLSAGASERLAEWMRWKVSGDPRIMEQMLTRYEPAVFRKLRECDLNRSMNREDFAQEVRLFIWDAIRSWDPNRQAQLLTHVCNNVDYALQFGRDRNVIAGAGKIPCHALQNHYRIERATVRLRAQGHEPTPEAIALLVGLTPEQVTATSTNVDRMLYPVRIDMRRHNNEDPDNSDLTMEPVDTQNDPLQLVTSDKWLFREKVSGLPSRLRHIIERRAAGDTFDEIARSFRPRITRERVRQLEVIAINRMRGSLGLSESGSRYRKPEPIAA